MTDASEISFADLISIYRSCSFQEINSRCQIALDKRSLTLLRKIESLPDTRKYAISIHDDLKEKKPGDIIHIVIGSPNASVCKIYQSFEDMANNKQNIYDIPKKFYIINDDISSLDETNDDIAKLKAASNLYLVIQNSVDYVDKEQGSINAFKDKPYKSYIKYNYDDINGIDEKSIQKLVGFFDKDIYFDQKKSIFKGVICELIENEKEGQHNTFEYILRNPSSIYTKVLNGFNLFASNFSYEKVKAELENSKIEFIGRVNKSFVDLQGQMLGIPISTIVIATQMKNSSGCSPELYSNIAVFIGSIIFLLIFMVSLNNQFNTLNLINEEIERGVGKIIRTHPSHNIDFSSIYDQLRKRVYRIKLIGYTIGIICLLCALFSVFILYLYTNGVSSSCFISEKQTSGYEIRMDNV